VKKIYVDTSAFFKVFVEEEASKVVERLIRLAREKLIKIVLSDWVINESIALINENNRKGKINSTETQHILSELINMIRGEIQHENFTFYSINEAIVIGSRFDIQDYNISASDALHVSIAAASDCNYFLSADKQLIEQLTTGSHKLIAYNIIINEDVRRMFNDIESS
jgi:predicted nucleic acid-binding protein